MISLNGRSLSYETFSVNRSEYSCSGKIQQEDGCVMANQTNYYYKKEETCVCTGNLCNSGFTREINFIIAFSCLLISLVKFAIWKKFQKVKKRRTEKYDKENCTHLLTIIMGICLSVHSVLERIWIKVSYLSQWLSQGKRGPPKES